MSKGDGRERLGNIFRNPGSRISRNDLSAHGKGSAGLPKARILHFRLTGTRNDSFGRRVLGRGPQRLLGEARYSLLISSLRALTILL